jgi:hypothetical protein
VHSRPALGSHRPSRPGSRDGEHPDRADQHQRRAVHPRWQGRAHRSPPRRHGRQPGVHLLRRSRRTRIANGPAIDLPWDPMFSGCAPIVGPAGPVPYSALQGG